MKDLFLPANILLPKCNFEKWAVIACDQFTSEPDYWNKVKKISYGFPSSYNLILPEAFLESDNSQKIKKINNNMNNYLNGKVFKEYDSTIVYTERIMDGGKKRYGMIGLIDLEDYSYEKGSNTLIRATEQTVKERIPARVEIRRDAPIEIPHVMLLIDDEDNNVLGYLSNNSEKYDTLYDFDLMLGGGHVKGMRVDEDGIKNIQNSLNELKNKNEFGFLFAVGDGNHSLAAAKECYKLNGTEESRYALVEVVNIHDESIQFEPIYRVVFGVDPKVIIDQFISYCNGEYFGDDAQQFQCLYGDSIRNISVRPIGKLSVATLQKFLDEYILKNPNVRIDYIHGEQAVENLSKKSNTLGFLFEGMKKSELFSAVSQDGSLPRKTFSMGHAEEKRYYIECRKI